MIRSLQQIALVQHDVGRAVPFYRDVLGLPLLFETAGMAFFDVAGVRLMLTPPSTAEFDHPNSVLYFEVVDLADTFAAIVARGAVMERAPSLVGRTERFEIHTGFIRDPEGNLIGLSEQRPLGSDPARQADPRS
ncbi:MAG: hypothetical protein EBT79_13870 [Actinobacteria bacterium]|jgi:predicted enzyme related to lactoylglutathione lyase|nr:hypothetical protein [Actinomycetota bacterium]